MVRDEYNHSRPVSALIRDWLLYNKAGGGGGILKTVTGNPISVSDALAARIQSLSVSLSPIQSGSGDPYPAGGGKNKFNGTFLQGYWAYADGTWVNSPNWITTEKIPCKASTSYTVSADAKVTRWQGFVWYDSNGDFISTDNLNSNVNIGLTKTSPSNAAYLIFNIAGYPSSIDIIKPSDVTHFQLEEGQAATAYSPYENIRPITGRTAVTVTRTGKNLFDKTTVTPTSFVSADGTLAYSTNYAASDYIPVKSGVSMIVSGLTASSAAIKTAFYDREKVFISAVSQNKPTYSFTTPSGAEYARITVPNADLDTAQLELGSTPSAYAPYDDQSATIQLGQTVYGGTLDVTTGVLTVNMAMVDLGAKNWYPSTAAGRTRFRTSITDIERISSPNVRAPMLCSAYKTETANNTYTGKQGISLQQNETDVYVYDAQRESMTTADFKTAMSGVQLVYKLATPITYHLTPQEVRTLLGTNNVWSDGDDISMTYKAVAE